MNIREQIARLGVSNIYMNRQLPDPAIDTGVVDVPVVPAAAPVAPVAAPAAPTQMNLWKAIGVGSLPLVAAGLVYAGSCMGTNETPPAIQPTQPQVESAPAPEREGSLLQYLEDEGMHRWE